jgi:hypothetical protein
MRGCVPERLAALLVARDRRGRVAPRALPSALGRTLAGTLGQERCPGRAVRSLLGRNLAGDFFPEAAKLVATLRELKLLEGADFDLPNALAADLEDRADFLKGVGVTVA